MEKIVKFVEFIDIVINEAKLAVAETYLANSFEKAKENKYFDVKLKMLASLITMHSLLNEDIIKLSNNTFITDDKSFIRFDASKIVRKIMMFQCKFKVSDKALETGITFAYLHCSSNFAPSYCYCVPEFPAYYRNRGWGQAKIMNYIIDDIINQLSSKFIDLDFYISDYRDKLEKFVNNIADSNLVDNYDSILGTLMDCIYEDGSNF